MEDDTITLLQDGAYNITLYSDRYITEDLMLSVSYLKNHVTLYLTPEEVRTISKKLRRAVKELRPKKEKR